MHHHPGDGRGDHVGLTPVGEQLAPSGVLRGLRLRGLAARRDQRALAGGLPRDERLLLVEESAAPRGGSAAACAISPRCGPSLARRARRASDPRPRGLPRAPRSRARRRPPRHSRARHRPERRPRVRAPRRRRRGCASPPTRPNATALDQRRIDRNGAQRSRQCFDLDRARLLAAGEQQDERDREPPHRFLSRAPVARAMSTSARSACALASIQRTSAAWSARRAFSTAKRSLAPASKRSRAMRKASRAGATAPCASTPVLDARARAPRGACERHALPRARSDRARRQPARSGAAPEPPRRHRRHDRQRQGELCLHQPIGGSFARDRRTERDHAPRLARA
jgi:hypothetical protein